MLEKIKNIFLFKYVDKCIKEDNYDLALESLNRLINAEYKLSETFLKRGMLCHKLLMLDEAYSDFTYIITHCVKKQKAYYERMYLNYEIGNYFEAISDANKLLEEYPTEFKFKCIKFLSYVCIGQLDLAKEYILNTFDDNKYQTIQFLFKQTTQLAANDEPSKALKILDIIDMIDPDNPLKIFKEANIYGQAGEKEREHNLIARLDSVFPKYFISHFRFTDMYQERDFLEICFLLELQIFDKQNYFAYPMNILRGYKYHMEGKIIDSKEAFEQAIELNPDKPEAYALLGQTLQLMSGYDNPAYKIEAEKNYRKAMELYQRDNRTAKTEDMKRQIRHLNSSLSFH